MNENSKNIEIFLFLFLLLSYIYLNIIFLNNSKVLFYYYKLSQLTNKKID